MKIIACLGNPEKEYNKNRHNAGFIIGNYFVERFNISISKKPFLYLYGRGRVEDIDLLILFPLTFMNRSGQAVKAALQYYRESPENLLVIHDEIELPFGEIKTKLGGGHRGHNGVRSIIQQIGTPMFNRLCFGVGRPSNPEISVADYLLSNFKGEELMKIEELSPIIIDKIISTIIQP